MKRSALAAAIFLAVPHILVAQPPTAAEPAVSVDRRQLVFGALAGGHERVLVTPPQRLFLEARGPQGLPWTMVADRDWLDVQPASGQIPARLTVSVRPSAIAGLPHDDEGHIVVTVAKGGTRSETVLVRLRVLREPHPPVGSFDAPGDGTVVTGVARLSGWALHDVSLAGVWICRDPVPRSVRNDACGDSLSPIGEASFYYAERPDVALVVPTAPLRERSGWTYVLDARAFPKGTRGTFRVYAVATAIDGTRSVLGVRTITMLPDAASWWQLSPRTRAIGLWLCAGLICHMLLLWWCGRRLRHVTPPATSQAPLTWLELVGVASAAGLSLAMNLGRLTEGLTYDELYTASHYVIGVPVWTAAVHATTFTNHMAYSLLAAACARMLGASEFALRLPAALLGALAVFALWRYMRSWAGRATALGSALILAFMPFHTHWSRMARGYTGLALMTVIAVHGFSTIVRHGSRGGAMAHAVGLVLAVYFHLYAAFVFLTQYALFAVLALVSAWRPGAGAALTRRSFHLFWISFLSAAAILVVLYAPVANGLLDLLPFFAQRAGIRSELFLDVFSAFSGTGPALVRIGIGVVMTLGAVHLFRHARLEALHLALLIVLPMSIVVFVLRPRVELERYFGYWSPAFAAFQAGGFAWLAGSRPRAVRPTALLVLRTAIAVGLLVVLGATWSRQDVLAGPRGGYRELLETLNDPPQTPVFVVGADSEMFQYYVHQPITTLGSIEELEQMLVDVPFARVAFHRVGWNPSVLRQMGGLLQRRCREADHGVVAIYECGG